MPRFTPHPALARTTPLALSFNGNGDNVVIAAAGRIFVYRLAIIAASAVNAIFKDGATTNLWPAIPLPTTLPLVLDFDTEPWFTMTTGNAFIINLSSGVACAGCVYYTTAAGLT